MIGFSERALASATKVLGPPLVAFAAYFSFGAAAYALPAFAIQTGQPCASCHVGGFGPQLTQFGRDFKLHGYTMRAVDPLGSAPVSMMAVASYLHTNSDQDGAPAPHYSANDNTTLDEASLFLAGGAGHFGGFVQTTYDGVGRSWSWDNVDLRAATDTTIGGASVVAGLSLNNSPGTQDVWNSMPAWGYPYTDSGLAPGPAAATVISDAFAQNVFGLSAYAWWNASVYTEFGLYWSPGASFLDHMGVDPADTNEIRNSAPYARLAYQKTFGDRSVEIGAFGLFADVYPGRDHSADAVDRVRDLGVDASYDETNGRGDTLSAHARYTHESQRLRASQALGGAENLDNSLNDLRADFSYYFKNRVGVTAAPFATWGSRDSELYADSSSFSPNSSGLMLQLDATPFGGEGQSPFGPRFNVRVGAQYVIYDKFDGARHNYDGNGRDASDNNTLRIFTWFAY
jgi:hypothetical protein